ncbi:MAG: 1-aminocyclopropane-1-carboxylate deaminase/D-cysteine desulfhydrase [Flavobacteriaceae bacterium]|nr:pyridoxal-phosphate dependent enzyme [Bacteroidia bacterium]NNL16669.1 1-aminocyclopropane-1-carboxylate deaminase/D-cysteine desulfhydrase [Flavobacteriaceae bacterium]
MKYNLKKSVNNKILLPDELGIELYIKRDDLIHPNISGNKYRKLKYNIEEAQQLNFKRLLTFGGAFSNHIAAVASVGKKFGFNTIGIIRGEELEERIYENPTLNFAKGCGMEFKFISRKDYRNKTSKKFIKNLQNEFDSFYLLPEGGTNGLAVKGCEEILTEDDARFDFICSSVGTGGTISGLINSSLPDQQVLGFPALKGNFLKNEIIKFADKTNWKLIDDYHFGGYAKVSVELIEFINIFKKNTGIPLDPVYTGKMLFGIFDMINADFFPKGSKILAIHTGGLQGIQGMNKLLIKKNLPILAI